MFEIIDEQWANMAKGWTIWLFLGIVFNAFEEEKEAECLFEFGLKLAKRKVKELI